MGCSGRVHVGQNIELERVVTMWENLFAELLAERGQRGERGGA